VRGIVLKFESFDALEHELAIAGDDKELGLAFAEGLRDGEWVLATFSVGDEGTSLAACFIDGAPGARLSFACRDWEKLWSFALGRGPSSRPPEHLADPCQVQPPPDACVLVLDDDNDLKQVLKGVLSASGFCADAVSTAEEALDYAGHRRVDLLVVDCNRPGANGIELCNRLRRDPRLGKVPVLMLTTSASTRDQTAAFAAGVDDVVAKPFRAPELGARVLGLLHRTSSFPPH
jgi:two-component system phosphate regulon response regulator PhoB